MKSRRPCLVLGLAFLASARLQSQAAVSPEEIEALMRRSGLQAQIVILPPQIEQAVLQQDSGLDPERVSVFRKAKASAFAVDRMQGRARDLLQARLGREDVDLVGRWYASPLGQRILELERKGGKPERYAAVQGDLAKLVGAERLPRIERIEAGVQTAEGILIWVQHAGVLIQKAKYLVWGLDFQVDDGAEQAARLRPKVQRMMLLNTAETLRSLTLEDLDRYVSFAESPSAKRWHRAMWDSLDLVLTKGMEEVVAALPVPSRLDHKIPPT